MFTEDDQRFMLKALELAHSAEKIGEVPVGALLVHQNHILGQGFNQPIHSHDPSAHAEMLALREGANTLKNYRLVDTTLYVTLEPCLMCVGAIVHARVRRVVFGAFDAKAGALQSVFSVSNFSGLNHRPHYEGGLMAEACGELLKNFFLDRRRK